MENIKEEIESFEENYGKWYETYSPALNDEINNLELLIKNFSPENENDENSSKLNTFGEALLAQNASDLVEILTKCKEQLLSLSKEFKEIETSLSEDFFTNLSNMSRPVDLEAHDNYRNTIGELIAEHFACEGEPELFKTLVDEIEEVDSRKTDVAGSHGHSSILKAFDEEDFVKVLECLKEASADSEELIFCVHKLRLMQLLDTGTKKEAIEYCRKNLSDKIESMKSLFFSISLKNREQVYPDLFNNVLKVRTRKMLTRLIFGDSILKKILEAGIEILPRITTILKVLRSPDILSFDELPLKNNFTNPYHSVVKCPIMKVQCTSRNPPYRAKCGHVVSEKGFRQEPNGDEEGIVNPNQVYRCTFCNIGSTKSEARLIIL